MLSIGAPPTFTRNGQLLWITKSALSFSSDKAESSQGSWNVFYSSQYFSKTDQQRRFSKLLPSGSRKDQHSGAVLLTVVVSVFMFEYSCFFLLLFCVCVYICFVERVSTVVQWCLTVVVKIDCAGSPKKHRGMLNIYFQIVLQSKGFRRARTHKHQTIYQMNSFTIALFEKF